MERVVEPEILDTLAWDDPAALGNRRDLRVINALMGNFSWFGSELRQHLHPGENVLELAAGDGALGRYLYRHVFSPLAHQGDYYGLDRIPRPERWPDEWRWLEADLEGWCAEEACDIVIGNFILHQLTREQLAGLGEKLQSARVLLFNETARNQAALYLARLGYVLGFNHVSRHDAPVSVRAGFKGHELPQWLGLSDDAWRIQTSWTPWGSYRMKAIRKDTQR
ncbi:MAG: hypothetical protein E1N59_1715 [Puniceicoccaceae bacterium 5H]|nr:MAG: hypothetical protein E1N59_1715 [Puniceicoccaceae bacterium 5H]